MARRAKPAKKKSPATRSPVRTGAAARARDLEARLRDALDHQRATSEILRIISASPADAQPVFDAIARHAVNLCGGLTSGVRLVENGALQLKAVHNLTPEAAEVMHGHARRPITRDSPSGQAILDREVVNIDDALEDVRFGSATLEITRAVGHRGMVSVPMLRDGEAIGVIMVGRPEAGAFSDREVDLLKIFADQAVIAIENARLFTELRASNRELTTALDTQTATADILRVISRTQTNVQPVFDAIVTSAVRLLRAFAGSLARVEGDQLVLAAMTSTDAAGDAAVHVRFPMSIHSAQDHAQAFRARAPLNVRDARDDSRLPEDVRASARVRGYRSQLIVPLLRHDEVIGTLGVARGEPGGFADDEIALLQTFADQAVIAIENVRLFTELQTSNRELTTALDTQTATSDILRVISDSRTDVQPVFDAIAQSAVRLLQASAASVLRRAGDQVELVALTSTDAAGDAATRAAFPRPLQSDTPTAWAIRDRVPINIADHQTDLRLSDENRATSRVRGRRSVVVVPLLRHDEAIGAIAVTRREPGGFADDEIALLQTFADQAVIAIENVRLFTELQTRTQELTRSVDQLTALGDVGRAVSSSLDLDTVLTTIVRRAVQLSDTNGGTIFEYDEAAEEFSARATLNAEADQAATVRPARLRRGEGAVGQLAVTREPIQISDIAAAGAYESRLRGALLAAGTRSILAIPLLHETRLVGGLVVTRNTPGTFTADTVELLRTFATQSALAIQNARLFREIEVKSRELEVASQHKSEFLASMSHELRTPLNAIIGFSDVLLQGMFGDTNEKQAEYLRDILSSGEHLLSLINDILDLAKIEAGRMDLDLAPFHLPTAVDDALLLMRERAGRRGITLEKHVDALVGEIRADQRKVKQVLLNLLSNAVKFTPEGGRIDVRVDLADGSAEIAVTDTGIGIAPADYDAVFEEFRQVGAADKKADGTGLGLALCRKFVELHGGRIWVKSQLGSGSTFTFTLPITPPA